MISSAKKIITENRIQTAINGIEDVLMENKIDPVAVFSIAIELADMKNAVIAILDKED